MTSQTRYGVPIIILVMMVFFAMYVIMIYPEERVKILTDNYENANREIMITGEGFTPSEITINVGESVKWVNKDGLRHKINFGDEESPTLFPGGTYVKQFDNVGVFVYSDFYEPNMNGKIIVK